MFSQANTPGMSRLARARKELQCHVLGMDSNVVRR